MLRGFRVSVYGQRPGPRPKWRKNRALGVSGGGEEDQSKGGRGRKTRVPGVYVRGGGGRPGCQGCMLGGKTRVPGVYVRGCVCVEDVCQYGSRWWW